MGDRDADRVFMYRKAYPRRGSDRAALPSLHYYRRMDEGSLRFTACDFE
jgi:hypothetical protein